MFSVASPWSFFDQKFVSGTSSARTISPIAPGGAEPAPNSANQKQEATQGGKAKQAQGKTNSRSKEADVDP